MTIAHGHDHAHASKGESVELKHSAPDEVREF